jgi:hypothetical protein
MTLVKQMNKVTLFNFYINDIYKCIYHLIFPFSKNLVLVEENLILVVYWYEGEIIEDFFLLDVVIYILK